MNISVKWSSDLTVLAEDLWKCWQAVNNQAKDDPFKKIAVVINDTATGKWLKEYLLLERKIPQIMMNLEFVMLPEFVNDWLWSVCGKSLQERQASQHPYSKNVLSWRIYRLLEQASPDGELSELLKYVNAGDTRNAPERRYALSARLASLYDDYLNSRYMMLRKWETENLSNDSAVPQWQSALYKKLAAEEPETYAKEYVEAFQTRADQAFEHGFPHYLAVFVFDVPFISEPTMRLLEKISEALPITFWNFNPKGDWLAETPSANEVKRKLKDNLKACLENHKNRLRDGCQPDSEQMEIEVEQFYDSPVERLLGALASGARGTLGALFDIQEDVEVLPGNEAFNRLPSMNISVHSVYSRRRELEAVRDGLHDFLKTTGAAPHEALVLCADWASYAPVIEAVFPPDSTHEGFIPIAMERMQGESPILKSFSNLLKFRDNRFEVSAVFALLDVPEIRERYGLSESAVETLRDMVKKANIHWGLDDADVRDTLGLSDESGQETSVPYPFTWQRGLDRLTAELLYGFTDDRTIIDVSKITQLHPCGHVEGERAKCVVSLWTLVRDLATLRRQTLPKGHRGKVTQMRDDLLNLLPTFYEENGNNYYDFNEIRKAVISVAESMERALGPDAEVEADVFVKAVKEAICGHLAGRRSAAPAVQFAPLNAYTATPHRFIWICGLNDTFPRMERRPTYDMIGRHPSLFDVTSRERNAFALLKATLCASERLAFSYIGKEMRNNENVTPSVLLDDLTDFFVAASIPFTRYVHPLQGYSQRYFYHTAKPEDALPPTYSTSYNEINQALAGPPNTHLPLEAFRLKDEGVTEIALDDLIEFFSHPNRYLFKKRLGATTPWFEDFDDSECLEAKLDKSIMRELALGEGECKVFAELTVETGHAPDMRSAEEAVKGVAVHSLAADYNKFEKEKIEETKTIELEINQKIVHLIGNFETACQGETRRTIMFVDNLDHAKRGICIRHIAANAAYVNGVTTIAFCPGGSQTKTCEPCSVADAKGKLSDLLRLAVATLPPEYPDYGMTGTQDDKLPAQWEEFVKEIEA
ncbi:MAG: exodeoxyribonuclease V subunit gamma [Victivallales bacterium]|nr:exodeoxyribonuclease V subunit gamma [Victivallales bacterium]